jgi:prepilin-type N-terminal cleavage/methylation domain-containing protein
MLARMPDPNHLSPEPFAMKSSRAFTLIELLIVIAILGILMALLFPAVQGALDSAKRAQAKNDVVQIATAVTAYETEYGRLPATNGSGAAISADVLGALMGSNSGTGLNPRQIVFLEVQTAKKGKSGISNSTFVDPWGGAYVIAYDDNYDNRLSSVGTNGMDVMKKVAVWNDPSSHNPDPGTSKRNKRYVTSWE